MSQKEKNNITAEELYTLLKKNSEGDRTAKNRLAELYIDLAMRMAKEKMAMNKGIDEQEIMSASFLGLMNGIDTYDIESTISYTEHLSKNIRLSIDAAVKENSKVIKELSLDALEPYESRISDGKADLASIMNRKQILNALRAIASTFLPCELYILQMHFGFIGDKEQSAKEIATTLGTTEEYVNEVLTRNLKVLKEQIYEVAEGRFKKELELDTDTLLEDKKVRL